jgi:hypothetical protein
VRTLLLIFFFLATTIGVSQNDSTNRAEDSTARRRAINKAIYSDARKAAVMSAILPGLGQGYNRKYWKIPIIYGALGGLGYIFIQNNEQYQYYRTNLRAAADLDSSTVNNSGYDITQLKDQKAYYKRFRDLSIIGLAAVYFLNIIDANVDAHLKTFDVSDDLGLMVRPSADLEVTSFGMRMRPSLTLTLKIKR